MLTDYAETLRKHGCRLMLAEIEAQARDTLEHTGTLDLIGPDNVFGGTDQVGESIRRRTGCCDPLAGGRRLGASARRRSFRSAPCLSGS